MILVITRTSREVGTLQQMICCIICLFVAENCVLCVLPWVHLMMFCCDPVRLLWHRDEWILKCGFAVWTSYCTWVCKELLLELTMMVIIVKVNLNHGETLAEADTEVCPAECQHWDQQGGRGWWGSRWRWQFMKKKKFMRMKSLILRMTTRQVKVRWFSPENSWRSLLAFANNSPTCCTSWLWYWCKKTKDQNLNSWQIFLWP